ncbi:MULTISPECIES: ChrR family anti-sigma-E factor [unclassified Rhizobium]|uniref:ChrR family anti-sigma-E factor n=1 Tax=unclassified Rhizobium TaxID=2613769 RepID=UPI001AD9539E|nr:MULTISPECIES: ChrR family anti-sigma-E factor [unclassified Rhizobium]MBO9098256.1 cupin domain-containing protein [Rhizobium sp. L58/93]MBO9132939.1 cupin domain-containing protein [Rhizobium sp. B209b/85]MBO9168522.1 cupin domain-containing protein [Rhizobium sp. L245/93]MBO9184452.1 cupin domain-containing protein [Rhizobium sp. E27B/91]QXZ84659.1 cupin domain-containing protein [Rhizobium sp. K1/93]
MVGNQIDTFDALMAHYVAGSLPEPARILVAAHLEMQPINRLIVHDLEALAGEALEQMPAADPGDRNARLAAIFASPASSEPAPRPVERSGDGGLPQTLRDFIGYDLADIPWRSKLPGFKKYGLGEIDGCKVNLMWIRAGRKLPTHTHEGAELTLVLEGAFSDARGRYGPGEISIADDSIVHRPVAENDRPCIAFSVLEAPIKFKGPLTRLVGDLLG